MVFFAELEAELGVFGEVWVEVFVSFDGAVVVGNDFFESFEASIVHIGGGEGEVAETWGGEFSTEAIVVELVIREISSAVAVEAVCSVLLAARGEGGRGGPSLEVGRFGDFVDAAFDTVPNDSDGIVWAVGSASFKGGVSIRSTAEDFDHGFFDCFNSGGQSRIAKVVEGKVVRVSRGAVGLYGGEVGPGSIREFRSDAVADILFVEIKVDSLREAEVSFVSIVFHVVT